MGRLRAIHISNAVVVYKIDKNTFQRWHLPGKLIAGDPCQGT